MALHILTRDIQQVGSRPVALFFHAYPMDHRMWLAVIDRLDGMPVMLVDAPGFGASEATVDTPSVDAYVDSVASQLGRYGVEKVVAIGSSMGGYAALALAARHPKLMSGIAMIGSRADADTAELKASRLENLVKMMAGGRQEILDKAVEAMFSESTRRIRPEIVQQAIAWSHDASDDGIAWAQRMIMARPARMDVLQNIGLPGLVMRGEEDQMVSEEHNREMALSLGTEVVPVRSTGHLIPIEDPGAVSRALMTLYPQCK